MSLMSSRSPSPLQRDSFQWVVLLKQSFRETKLVSAEDIIVVKHSLGFIKARPHFNLSEAVTNLGRRLGPAKHRFYVCVH
ncbi:hypothetical protein ACHAXT_005797 [Thalassiosira profunda]